MKDANTDLAENDWVLSIDHHPVFLNYVCLTNGRKPPPHDKEFTYVYLSQNGSFTVKALAQMFPLGKFWAVDVTQAKHKTNTYPLDKIELSNAVHNKIEITAIESLSLPKFDYIIIEKIFSKVSEKNRTLICEFLKEHLKPGGIAYLSYNSFPGSNIALNIREFIKSVIEPQQTDFPEQIREKVRLLDTLKANGATYFKDNPKAVLHLSELQSQSTEITSRNIFDNNMYPYYFHQISEKMLSIGLEFAGSTLLNLNFVDLAVPEEFQELLKNSKTRSEFEIIGDFVRNQHFRRDIYVNKAPVLNESEQTKILTQIPFGSICDETSFSRSIDFGSITLDYNHTLFNKLINTFCKKATTVEELKSSEHFTEHPPEMILDALRYLAAGKQIIPFNHSTYVADDSSLLANRYKINNQLNIEILKQCLFKKSTIYLVGLSAGVGIEVSNKDALFLLCSVEAPREKVGEWSLQRLSEAGIDIALNGKSDIGEIAKELEIFRRSCLPKLLELGILENTLTIPEV